MDGLAHRAAAARPPSSWWDLLDIALVSFLIYELLLLIRGTRAVQMALSGGFLIGLFFLSRWLAARDGQLGHSQPGHLRRLRHHRAVSGRHPPRAGALRPRAVLPLLRARGERRRDDRGARRRGDARWRRAASARSSSSSGRSGCATTSRAAFRSTRRSPTTCWRASSSRARRCMTAPSSSRAIASRRRPASCRCRSIRASAASSARGIARRSGSPRRTTPSRSSCPRRPAAISLVIGGDLERGLSPDALRDRACESLLGAPPACAPRAETRSSLA